MSSKPAPTLESIPVEIKLQILYKILDVKSLSSLVHACPTMHAVYASDRQRILTSATLKEMVAKRVDIFTPAPLLEVRLVNDPYLVSETLRLGIESLYSQLSTPKAKITLTVDHCKALAQLKNVIRWHWAKPDKEIRQRPFYCSVPGVFNPYWKYRPYYKMLVLGDLPEYVSGTISGHFTNQSQHLAMHRHEMDLEYDVQIRQNGTGVRYYWPAQAP